MSCNLAEKRRISVLGISGSGKSAFARQLHEKTGLPLYHMDSLYWGPSWTEIPEPVWKKGEAEILSTPSWIIEGYIDGKNTDRIKQSELIVYLDLPGRICAKNGMKRWWRHRKHPRPEMPEGCTEKLDLCYILTMLTRKERGEIETALQNITPEKVVRLKSCTEVKNFLTNGTL